MVARRLHHRVGPAGPRPRARPRPRGPRGFTPRRSGPVRTPSPPPTRAMPSPAGGTP